MIAPWLAPASRSIQNIAAWRFVSALRFFCALSAPLALVFIVNRRLRGDDALGSLHLAHAWRRDRGHADEDA
jgi:hypothetical protein